MALLTSATTANPSLALSGVQVYFQSKRASLNADLPAHLVNFIAGTQHSLDCAIYDLREPAVLAALRNVAASGKQLRIAYDNSQPDDVPSTVDPKHGDTEDLLQTSGLIRYATPVHAGGRHLMHNKFLIRDGQLLWTGSANFTQGGLVKQDNNCLVIASRSLCADYMRYFDTLLTDQHSKAHRASHGTVDAPSRQNSAISVGNVRIIPYFEPSAGEGIEDTIVSLLNRAHKVKIIAMLISDPGILGALYRFSNPRADIAGIYDAQEMSWTKRSRWLKNDRRQLTWFMNDPTRFVGFHSTPYRKTDPNFVADFMHNKVMILDDTLVLTGSYNFSENAEANDENLLLIESPEVAAAYMGYFEKLFDYYRHQPAILEQPALAPARTAGHRMAKRVKAHPRKKSARVTRRLTPLAFLLVVVMSIFVLVVVGLLTQFALIYFHVR